MITREFNLYLHAGHSIPLVINVNQYDRGESWVFTLFNSDGTQYTPSSGAIVGIKSDNLGIINTATVDSQGRVVVAETQQMTAAVGKAVFELVIDDGTHGTANFVVLVEPKPGDNADLSESDISMIEEAIEAASTIKPYGSPLVASTVAGMTDETKVYVYTGSETGYTSGHWYYYDGSDWADGGVYNSVAVQTDTTLAISGMAADAKKTGDEINDLKSQINQMSQSTGMSNDFKVALENLFRNLVAYSDDEDVDDYLDALHEAMYPTIPATAISLSANSLTFNTLNSTQQLTATLTPSNSTSTVSWNTSDPSVATVSNTGLVTAIAYGSATITATAGNVSATCPITVATVTVSSISAVFTQGANVVYDIDTLDSLKQYLVVTALWSDNTSSVVANNDYTLSGTLTAGTSAITVSYANKTTTFNVTVTAFAWDYTWEYTDGLPDSSGNGYTKTANTSTSVSMENNGLLVSCTNNSGSIQYILSAQSSKIPCSKLIFEDVFEVKSFASSGNGQGLYILVFNGTRAANVAINGDGVIRYYDAGSSGWTSADVTVALDTEYTLRIETDNNGCSIYLDNALIATATLGNTTVTQSKVFQQNGGSTLHKSWKYKFES